MVGAGGQLARWESISEMDSGDYCTTMCVCLMALSGSLKMVKVVIVILCIFDHNFQSFLPPTHTTHAPWSELLISFISGMNQPIQGDPETDIITGFGSLENANSS